MFRTLAHRFSSSPSGERGATMLEMSLVTPVLVLLLFGVIDFSRYMAARAVITKAAQNAINYAQRASTLDTDTRQLTTSDPAYALFQVRRAAVQDRAVQLAQSIFVSGFATYRNLDQMSGGGTNSVPPTNTTGLGALILRPGEEARRRVSGIRTESVVTHPTLCPPGYSVSATCPAVASPTDGWIDILKNHPMYIELQGEVAPILPLLPRVIPIRVTAFGYREIGTDADALPPLPQIIPSVTSTSTSTTTTSTTTTSSTTTTIPTTTTTTSLTTTTATTTSTTSLTTSTTSTSTSTTSFTTSTSSTSTSTTSSTAASTTTSTTTTTTTSTTVSTTTSTSTTTTTWIRCANNVDLAGDACTGWPGGTYGCGCGLYGDCCGYGQQNPTSTVCCPSGQHLLYVATNSFICGEVCYCKGPDSIVCADD